MNKKQKPKKKVIDSFVDPKPKSKPTVDHGSMENLLARFQLRGKKPLGR